MTTNVPRVPNTRGSMAGNFLSVGGFIIAAGGAVGKRVDKFVVAI